MACVTSTVNSSPIPSVSVTTAQQDVRPLDTTQITTSTEIGLVNAIPTSGSSSVLSNPHPGVKSLNKTRIQELVREIDPNEQLDEDVEEVLLQIADEFIENIVTTSCFLAKHRNSNILEVKDIQLTLEKNWNMWIPGFGCEELRPYKKSSSTEAHKQRMALIRKALKK